MVRIKLNIFITSLLIVFTTLSVKVVGQELQEKPEIIYVYDPLCGWCYGFTPVIEKIKNKYQGETRFKVLTGGLALNGQGTPVSVSYEYVKSAMSDVEATTRVVFGEAFYNLMQGGTYVYNSETPCLAQYIVKEMKPDSGFAFGKDLQRLIFNDGKNLNDTSLYMNLIKSYDIDSTHFLEKFRDHLYKDMVYKEFDDVSILGINSFPAVLLKRGGKTDVISSGYINFEKLDKLISRKLKK